MFPGAATYCCFKSLLISNWHLTMGWSWVVFIKMHFRGINLKRSSPTLKLVNFGNDESQGGLMSKALFHHSSLELNATVQNIHRNLSNMGWMRQLWLLPTISKLKKRSHLSWDPRFVTSIQATEWLLVGLALSYGSCLWSGFWAW